MSGSIEGTPPRKSPKTEESKEVGVKDSTFLEKCPVLIAVALEMRKTLGTLAKGAEVRAGTISETQQEIQRQLKYNRDNPLVQVHYDDDTVHEGQLTSEQIQNRQTIKNHMIAEGHISALNNRQEIEINGAATSAQNMSQLYGAYSGLMDTFDNIYKKACLTRE
ncbi:MAG: hypothetical protein S4CHLAM45_08540 [Chlamydiales bacterium]|nr:hypothetical protein [Chlamydiales bacterium]MCH9620396.1 hypothetical protein [Chlamydiales bacterium]MCH9622958.1 hypothetical protein [Chlamydiales bacterium]